MKAPVAILGLILIFLCASFMLVLVANFHPRTNSQEEDQILFRFPSNIKDLKQFATFAKSYRQQHRYYVFGLFCCAYVYKQTFAIPGSVLMNLLSGILFETWKAFPLVCLLTACGASCCFLLSKVFGKAILEAYFPTQLESLRSKVENNNDGLFFFLLFLRMFPMSPNWFLNLASPLLEIPISLFFPSVFIGLMPYNFICVQAGAVISQLNSISDIMTSDVIFKMMMMSLVAFVPGILLRKLRKKNT